MDSEYLRPGQPVPELSADAVMADGSFGTVKIGGKSDKFTVLLFYPLDFTFVCPTELQAFSEKYAEFQKQDAEVLGISVDSKFSHLAWIKAPLEDGGLGDMSYPLVSDMHRQWATTFGILDPDAGVALRGLFIIDPDGILQHATVSALNIGRSVDEALRVLAAVRHTRANPDEVCPVNWSPGQAVIRPDDEIAKKLQK